MGSLTWFTSGLHLVSWWHWGRISACTSHTEIRFASWPGPLVLGYPTVSARPPALREWSKAPVRAEVTLPEWIAEELLATREERT